MSSNIYERIAIYCEEYQLFQKEDRVVVGLSGGADSVFLLYALSRLRQKWGLQLFAVHINHGVRGEEALRDQQYAVAFAESLGIACKVYQTDVPALAKKEHLTEEEAGRIYRYQCFEEFRRENNCQSIAVAHHQEDQAETVLFQLLRGSGLRGMGGMRPKRDCIVRPLLGVSRQEIEQELRDREIAYCVDSTNIEDKYARNIIRHHILPYLQENIQPAAVSHIAETATQLQEVMEYIQMQTEMLYTELITKKGNSLVLSEEKFVALHPVLQRELVLAMIQSLAGQKKDITRKHIQSVCDLYLGGTGKKVSLPYSLVAEKSYQTLSMTKAGSRDERETVKKETQAGVPEGGAEKKENQAGVPENEEAKKENQADALVEGITIQLGVPYLILNEKNQRQQVYFEERTIEKFSGNYQKNYCTKCFDYDRMDTMPVLRYPKSGDYLWLDETGKKKKLSRLFIDAKVPLSQRKETVVLAEGNHVLWVPLLNRCSAYYYITRDTKKIVCARLTSAEETV
ncbi:MAG: tRNA lysidine(34) synthetase TilS [Butyribacter sp.]|nr:tRNA lysidine(34) synthetase TilS [bacterium]MDY3853881.1 tRNA lysidine(34) synthetase TilS [Butyribacter sp.]